MYDDGERGFRVHFAVVRHGEFVRCACGFFAVEKDGRHAWADGRSAFYAMEWHQVDCKRCIRAREEYVQRLTHVRFGVPSQ